MIELSGHDDLRLDDSRQGYIVQSGSIALYLVELQADRLVGQRHYVMTSHPGSLIWGGTEIVDDKQFVLVAEPHEKSSIEPVSASDLGDPIAGDSLNALEDWIEKLGEIIGKLQDQDFTEKAEIDEPVAFSPSQVFRPREGGLYRVRLSSGSISFGDRVNAAITPQSPPLVYYADHVLRLTACEASELTFERVSELAPESFAGTLYLQQAMIALLYGEIQQAERSEARRLEKLKNETARGQRKAIDHLKLKDDKDWEPDDQLDPLMTALEVIGHAAKIEFNTNAHFDQNQDVTDKVDKICRESGVRFRHVRLIGEWWKEDIGNVLCFQRETGTPFALVNTARHGGLVRSYIFYNAQTRESIPFDPDMDLDLNEEAFVFTRPLPESEEEATSFIKLARHTYKPFMTDFVLMFALSFLSGLLGLFMPIANRWLVDYVIPDANRDLLFDLAVGMGCMSLGLFFFSLSQGIISLRIQTSMTAQLQSMIIDRLLKLPVKFYRTYTSGDLLNRAMMISEISAGFSGTVISAGFSLLSVLMMLGMCFYYSSKLAFLALIAAVITSIFSISFSFIIRSVALRQERETGDLFGFMVQMVSGVSKLQIAGADSRAFTEWSKRYGDQLRMGFRVAELQHYSTLINMFIQTFSTIALYYFAGTMIKQGIDARALDPTAPVLLTIGSFFAIQGAFSAVVGGIVTFFSSFITIHQQMAKRELARPILTAEIETGAGKKSPPPLEGLVEIQHVTFRYNEEAPLILNDFSLRIFPGQFVAFVGKSGCGKSTLFKLLLGFEVPESGHILFDRNDSATLDMVNVRRQIGVVLQETSLSAGTIYHNIAGAAKITLDEAWEAAEDAGFAGDIREMPMGMHTVVPEGGGTLSGGQKQRLMIARALAINPAIVFFDEATSALDNRTQQIVTESLQRRKITRLVIAHRLSTVMHADKIVVLEDGKILEQGSYAELVEMNGTFASMARRQTVTEET
ncbi:NHLP bacteriocin export ABC transporter permease/ATPase subunit [Hwanghaeella grinnelliae]|uniref:NHLP bacteriocin export ABC transporter permease/ATPase subunit n=1 Tax=Hwanghaeella grinnelliae TaxID=2500179 RepID=A0A437QHG1_9PROT|nr:NHLP bacteriocin export ABC transporter permease/ATPase subunit [Hwanghaeella grinnelliae]RVU33962.1 NHLP bacteriocin export ABC transporter permease/ATPase subunit [Hwanghaeella grinnelliae]